MRYRFVAAIRNILHANLPLKLAIYTDFLTVKGCLGEHKIAIGAVEIVNIRDGQAIKKIMALPLLLNNILKLLVREYLGLLHFHAVSSYAIAHVYCCRAISFHTL